MGLAHASHTCFQSQARRGPKLFLKPPWCVVSAQEVTQWRLCHFEKPLHNLADPRKKYAYSLLVRFAQSTFSV